MWERGRCERKRGKSFVEGRVALAGSGIQGLVQTEGIDYALKHLNARVLDKHPNYTRLAGYIHVLYEEQPVTKL